MEGRFASILGELDADAYRKQVLNIVRKLGIEYFDGSETFANHEDPRSLYRGHFTVRGNQLFANAVIQFLKKDALDRGIR